MIVAAIIAYLAVSASNSGSWTFAPPRYASDGYHEMSVQYCVPRGTDDSNAGKIYCLIQFCVDTGLAG
jgi:hypothetical protein